MRRDINFDALYQSGELTYLTAASVFRLIFTSMVHRDLRGIISAKLTMAGLHRRGWTVGCSLMRFQCVGVGKILVMKISHEALHAYIQAEQSATFLSVLCQ